MRNEVNNQSDASANVEASQADAVERQHFYETMIRERRKFIRRIPVPQAFESNSDTDWAAFSDLMDDKSHQGDSA